MRTELEGTDSEPSPLRSPAQMAQLENRAASLPKMMPLEERKQFCGGSLLDFKSSRQCIIPSSKLYIKCLGWGCSRLLASMWNRGRCWALVSGAPAGGREGCSASAGGGQGHVASPILSSEAGRGPPGLSPEVAVSDPKDGVRIGGFKGLCSTAPDPGRDSLLRAPPGSSLPHHPRVCRGQQHPQALWNSKRAGAHLACS